MQHASEQSVLGNFNDAAFEKGGVRSRFFRKDGKLAAFEVKYTFGLDPLQQYSGRVKVAAREAETEYRAALRLGPTFAPAAVNLADLYRQLGRDADGEAVLRAALVTSKVDAGLHHALGLALTRMKQHKGGLAELRRGSELEPGSERYAYVYAVALHSSGRRDDALSLLKETLAKHPDSRDALVALISFSR